MDQILEKLRNKLDLSFEESKSAFELLMTGQANEDQIYDFLTLLDKICSLALLYASAKFW